MNTYNASKECLDKIEEFVNLLRTEYGLVNDPDCPDDGVLSLPGGVQKTYIGTYLNMFSCGEDSERPGKTYLWSDEYLQESARVCIAPLYRHNGAKKDVNVAVRVYHTHSTAYRSTVTGACVNPIFIREAKKSPTDILAESMHAVATGTLALEKKLLAKSGQKAMRNLAEKVVASLREFVPYDHSAEAADRAKFCPDTTKEYFEQKKRWEAENGRA